MLISIVNRSGKIPDADLHGVLRAINRQVAEDFQPYWSVGARLRLEGEIGKKPDKQRLPEMRGDAVLYLWGQADLEQALGYHDKNNFGMRYGFVFTQLAEQLGESWSVTLSHEALELIGDPQGNLLVQGPHPSVPDVEVFHWFEMCDAVQSQTYKVDGVDVANFVLPLYFTPGEQEGGRNDFLGLLDIKGKALDSFSSPKAVISDFTIRVRDSTRPTQSRTMRRRRSASASRRTTCSDAATCVCGRKPSSRVNGRTTVCCRICRARRLTEKERPARPIWLHMMPAPFS
jgi:hypothetical protein